MPSKVKKETNAEDLNQRDAQARKQGVWFTKVAPRMGEPGYMTFGTYKDDQKEGSWYTMDEEGRLVSIEHFLQGILNGEAQYYERGRLACVGHYRGFDPNHKIDSVWVKDPITYLDTLVAIENYHGALKHGLWRYYDVQSGRLIKEEEYQVDDLISKKEFDLSPATDSTWIQKRNEVLPHKKKTLFQPPAGKRRAYGY